MSSQHQFILSMIWVMIKQDFTYLPASVGGYGTMEVLLVCHVRPMEDEKEIGKILNRACEIPLVVYGHLPRPSKTASEAVVVG